MVLSALEYFDNLRRQLALGGVVPEVKVGLPDETQGPELFVAGVVVDGGSPSRKDVHFVVGGNDRPVVPGWFRFGGRFGG